MEKVLASSANVTKLRAFVSIGHGRLTVVGEGGGEGPLTCPHNTRVLETPVNVDRRKRRQRLLLGGGKVVVVPYKVVQFALLSVWLPVIV